MLDDTDRVRSELPFLRTRAPPRGRSCQAGVRANVKQLLRLSSHSNVGWANSHARSTLPAPAAGWPESLHLHPDKRRTVVFRRLMLLTYGILCYLLSLAVFLYAVGFMGGFLTPTR